MRMRMTSMIFLLLALGLVFSGCNGGGGMGPGAETPISSMQYTVDLMGLAVTIPRPTTIPAGGMVTFGDVTLSCPAGGSACTLKQNDEGNVTSTVAMVTARLSDEAMARIEEEQEERQQQMAAAQAKIQGLTMAIADPDGDRKSPEDNELTTNRRPGMEPTYTSGGVTTVDGDMLRKNDVTIKNSEEFGNASSAMRATISNFTEGVYTRTKGGKTDTLTIYTNAEPDKDQAFNTYYDTVNRAGADGAINVITAPPGTGTAGTTRYNVITFKADANLLANNREVTGSELPADATGTNIVGETLDADEKFKGTFHGVPGTFECTVDCTFKNSVDDGLQVTEGTLTFTPTNTKDDTQDVHMIRGVEKDSDYLSFGYWVQTMPMSDGSMKYGVNTFAGGSMAYGGTGAGDISNAIIALDGMATYEGPATGLYAQKDLTVEGGTVVVGTPAAAGQFVADATLTAYFGNVGPTGSSVSADNAFTIGGMVENFQDMDGETIEGNWMLKLNAADFQANGSTATNTFNGTTGEGSLGGQWRGGFYGPSTDDSGAAIMPSGVAGEFTGHFQNGHVIGAFGATNTN